MILVTGGAGYVGSVTVSHLVEEGRDLVVYDDLSTGHRSALPEDVPLVVGRVEEQEELRAVFSEYSVEKVLHLAACALVAESWDRPLDYYRKNVLGTLSLLTSMKESGVRDLVFSSSCSVYGIPREIPIPEDHPRAPISPYARSKRQAEEIFEDLASRGELRYLALRYFNAAGATDRLGEDHDPETHLIPNVLGVALDKRSEVEIFGDDYPTPDGTCIRDYVHIEDLATAHARALDALDEGVAGSLNLGTGKGSSVLEVVEAAREATGHPIPARVEPRREGDAPELVASPGRAREILGWDPRYADVDEILRTAWAWHRTHPDGYEEEAA